MLKKIIKKIRYLIVAFFRLFYSHGTAVKIAYHFNSMYTIWISKEFKEIGSNALFARPIYLKGGKYISIGKNFGADHRLRIDAYDSFLGHNFSPEIIIGDNVSIQKDCHIGAINKIVIGNNVLLASKVYISDHSHGQVNFAQLLIPPSQRELYSKGPVTIKDNVWIGEGAVVLPGVTIGRNSIIGANAVVSRSIPENCVAAGIPARIIKQF